MDAEEEEDAEEEDAEEEDAKEEEGVNVNMCTMSKQSYGTRPLIEEDEEKEGGGGRG